MIGITKNVHSMKTPIKHKQFQTFRIQISWRNTSFSFHNIGKTSDAITLLSRTYESYIRSRSIILSRNCARATSMGPSIEPYNQLGIAVNAMLRSIDGTIIPWEGIAWNRLETELLL